MVHQSRGAPLKFPTLLHSSPTTAPQSPLHRSSSAIPIQDPGGILGEISCEGGAAAAPAPLYPSLDQMKMEKEKRETKQCSEVETSKSRNFSEPFSIAQAFLVHLSCAVGLALALWVSHSFYSINLVSDPAPTLRLLWIVECMIVILLYSWFRLNPEQCSYLKAAGRGLLALPIGAVLNAFGAIVLGAPVGIQYLPKTINWSLLMSSFTVVPAACVFGSLRSHWQHLFAFTKPNESLEYMICIPAHGAIIGAWFGAWPMPLDWERPWQEWPICVSYGAMIGYVVAMLLSLAFVYLQGRPHHLKGE